MLVRGQTLAVLPGTWEMLGQLAGAVLQLERVPSSYNLGCPHWLVAHCAEAGPSAQVGASHEVYMLGLAVACQHC